MLRTSFRIWDMGSLICSKVAAFAGISLRFGHTSDPLPRVSDTETPLRYSRLCCSFRCQVFPGVWLKFWHNWDLQSSREWGDAVHGDCHLSRHFPFGCKRLIPLGLCCYINLCLIGILKVVAKMRWPVSSLSTCPLEEGRPVQLKHKCTDLANELPHLTRY